MAGAVFNLHAAPRFGMASTRGVCLVVLSVAMGMAWAARGQAAPDANPAAGPAHPHRPVHRNAAQPVQTPPAPQPVPVPVEPEKPKWPANEAPNEPYVKWDSQGLKISAFNSSLSTILNEVSNETGAKVEGMGSDERVFGDYGPGQARDVLAQLLHGSSYDYLLLGDEGQGTPREIILSTHREGSAAPAQGARQTPENPDEDYQPEPDDQGPQPPIFRPQMAPPQPMMPPRTPQQRFEEMRQRQLQMQQQQPQQQMPPEQPAPPQ